MQYKTIVLELLEQRPELHEQLKSQRILLATLEAYSLDLKTRHETWQAQLAKAKPGSDANQIASEALEIALQELENRLSSAEPPEEDGPLSLEGAMAFLRRHTPPA